MEAAIISGGDDYDDAVLPCLFNGLAERIQLVALVYRTAHRKIDDANVIGRFQGNRLVDGRDHNAVRSSPVRIKYAQIYKLCSWRDALESLAVDEPG